MSNHNQLLSLETELGCVPQYNFENKDARRNNWLNLAYSVLKSVENQNSNESMSSILNIFRCKYIIGYDWNSF
jgi:hypothetical protein